MSWDCELEEHLKQFYGLKCTENGRSPDPPAVTSAGNGFIMETADKLIFTAPAQKFSAASELPEGMRERWEKASTANPYFMWLHGRFVEAEKANRNGAFWSTQDLQFGEMSVKHGPLNWLHDARTVIGTIADNKLVTPPASPPVQYASDGTTGTMPLTYPPTMNTFATTTTNAISLAQTLAPRPYIAAVSAVWKWIYPDQTRAVEAASDAGNLWYSMECVAREMACHTEGQLTGCGKSFPYMQAMTRPETTCEHIAARSSARRMVDPAFLGGAVIIPPVQPGWGAASAQVMRQAATLAEQVAPTDARASQWEALMADVLRFAATA